MASFLNLNIFMITEKAFVVMLAMQSILNWI